MLEECFLPLAKRKKGGEEGSSIQSDPLPQKRGEGFSKLRFPWKRGDKRRNALQRQDAMIRSPILQRLVQGWQPPPVLFHTLINLLGEFLDLLDMLSADRTSHMTLMHVGDVLVKATHSKRQVNVVLGNVGTLEFLAACELLILAVELSKFGASRHQKQSCFVARVLRQQAVRTAAPS
jgi:hypothetical protein